MKNAPNAITLNNAGLAARKTYKKKKREIRCEWNKKNTFLLAIKYNNEFSTSHWFSWIRALNENKFMDLKHYYFILMRCILR